MTKTERWWLIAKMLAVSLPIAFGVAFFLSMWAGFAVTVLVAFSWRPTE